MFALVALLMAAAVAQTDAGVEASMAAMMQKYLEPASELEEQVVHEKKVGAKGRLQHPLVQIEEPGSGGNQEPSEAPRNGTALLSRFSFRESILSGEEGLIDHWVVEYCVHWWEPCQMIAPHYDAVGRKMEEELNAERAVTRRVRFARVNCAMDKVLCNEMGIKDYMVVKHYYEHKEVGSYKLNPRTIEKKKDKFVQWLRTQLIEKRWGVDAAEFGDDWPEVPQATEAALAAAIGLASCWAFWGVARIGAPGDSSSVEKQPPATAKAAPQGPAALRFVPERWAAERQQILL